LADEPPHGRAHESMTGQPMGPHLQKMKWESEDTPDYHEPARAKTTANRQVGGGSRVQGL